MTAQVKDQKAVRMQGYIGYGTSYQAVRKLGEYRFESGISNSLVTSESASLSSKPLPDCRLSIELKTKLRVQIYSHLVILSSQVHETLIRTTAIARSATRSRQPVCKSGSED